MPEGLSPEARIELGPSTNQFGDKLQDEEFRSIVVEFRRRYLEEPFFNVAEVLTWLKEEDDIQDLIARGELFAIADHDDLLFPAFQFGPTSHKVYDIVKQVNQLLDAQNDGWGVMSWWMEPHARLGTEIAPKHLLDDPAHHITLRLLAEATVKPDS